MDGVALSTHQALNKKPTRIEWALEFLRSWRLGIAKPGIRYNSFPKKI